MNKMEKKNTLVLLDKDGTIIKDKHYLGRYEGYMDEIELYPFVVEGIKLLNTTESKVAVGSNQAGVAREYFDCGRVKKIDREIDRRLGQQGAIIDSWHFCPYVDFDYAKRKNIILPNRWVAKNPGCRKPNNGMLKEACGRYGWNLKEVEMFVIGNAQSDVQTAENVGGIGYLVDMERHPKEFLEICKEITQKFKGFTKH